MGTHGRRGFDRLALGSVTEAVLRKAQCPVLAIHKPTHDFVVPASSHDPVQLKKILFCTDFSETSNQALKYAISLATEYAAELTLLHVLTELPASEEPPHTIADAAQRLEASVPPDAHEWCSVKPAVRVGKPYEEIIEYAVETKTDLIVMGVRGRNALDLAVFGSTTHRVIQLGSCAVLAVHS
jgi:nucleotide-binding universal stress UspA family protein